MDYVALSAFTFVALCMAFAPIIINYFLAPSAPSVAKNAPYECGFPPMGDARMPLDNRYYLMALLFVLFDIEIAFLFPWALVVRTCGVRGWLTMMVFLGILAMGLWYEWRKGALKWI